MKIVVENNVGMTTVSRFTYRYDELGRRTDKVDQGSTFGTDELSTWGYDELGQIVEQNRHAGNNPDSPGSAITAENFEFSYDHIGNRLTSQQGTATARAYGSNPLNQYTSITNPGASPQYDDDGNMTFDGVEWYYTWDGENRLIFARSYQTTASSGDVQISFAYDYQSRRVEKVVEEFNGTVWNVTTHRRFVYDGWNLLAELEEDSSDWETAQTYLWGLDLTQSFEGAGGVGGLLAITRNDAPGTTYCPTYDANGNVMELYDELGNNAAIYRYGPFGELVSISESPGVRNPYKFSTKYFDEELDLYYYGYRYYDPATGRWLNRDPIEEQGGLNLYGFVGNDGVNMFDVLGLSFWAVFEDVVRTVAGGFTIAAGVALGVTSGWTGVGAIGAAALITLGADQLLTGAASLASHLVGGGQINTTLIQYSYRSSSRAVFGDGSRVEETLDVIYFGAEVVSSCYTGYASIRAIIIARRAKTIEPVMDMTRLGSYPPAYQFNITDAYDLQMVVRSYVSVTDRAHATTVTISESVDLAFGFMNTFIVDVEENEIYYHEER